MQIRAFENSDEDSVVDLWRRCGLIRSWNDPYKDIARKMLVQSDLFLVGVVDDRIVATVMAGFDGHRGWINYLAVEPDDRRKGYGRMLMDRAEQLLRDLGCPKINVLIRHDNLDAIGFYERIGFRKDEVLSLGKRLERDD